METVALIIGYSILGILALEIIVFAVALGWFAVTEARGLIYARKWRKRKMKQMKLETARDFADYLCRWKLPSDMSIYEISNYFYKKLKDKKVEGEKL